MDVGEARELLPDSMIAHQTILEEIKLYCKLISIT
jgi:hypothetical protein